MMKRQNIILGLFLLLLPIWVGCTKEDYRNCPAGLYIAFEAQNPDDVYPDEVQNLSLYFFDPATGNFVTEYRYLRADLRETDKAAFIPQMPSGTYRVVAVVNDGIYTRTTGAGNYSTLETALDSRSMDYRPDNDLFISEKEITVTVNTGPIIPVETMTIVKHNNDIHLNIIYDDYALAAGTTLTSWIEGSNARYHHQNIVNSSTVRYTPWATGMDNIRQPNRFSFSTMRLHRDSDLKLYLQESSVTRAVIREFSFDLTDELARIIDETTPGNEFLYDTDQELEFNYEYEITLKFGRDKVQISVGVGLWDTIGGGVEL